MCSPSAPDNSGLNAAALKQADMSAEQLAFVKQIYGESAPDRAEASQRARATSDLQMQAAQKQMALTDDYSNYQKNTFRPLEQGIVADAQGYDTPERREAEAARSVAGVEQNLAMQQDMNNRNLARSGIQPGSAKALAMQETFDLGAAKLKAGAASQARMQVETIGAARKSDAANLGRNLASNQATSAGIALNQGNSAVANGQVPLNVAQGGVAMMNSGFAGAQQGLANSANTYGTIGNMNAKAAESDNAMWGALGQVGGAALKFSDKNMKENIEPLDPNDALEQVNATPLSTYNYKPGSPGALQEGTEQTAGPMAQDVQKTMGNKAAPKGKQIDLIAMNGITMGAIQALTHKVDKIMASKGITRISR